jgi:hypothetical protein
MTQFGDLYVTPNVKDYILNQFFYCGKFYLFGKKKEKPNNINKGFFLNDLKFTKFLPFFVLGSINR